MMDYADFKDSKEFNIKSELLVYPKRNDAEYRYGTRTAVFYLLTNDCAKNSCPSESL